ncbi:thiazole biosynthesis adenylyltransferase ThiF [Aneurinibacillus sp. Ricciae_BoGa-3]|uniref:thiazole biosynthesis adenylyltransferase ThiF n=1 Tax=Aneurinibacillus sp. Ricciae_BoGa-3 TaxID=3022697 RepID=UPI002341A5CD|nr:thiazole biosynthesis adenylyltransferase ThiF [Aneurinibacillus sp. Ricciae_BoGa-3]WCK55273.1 thiazole biosynthesis adenylyltransferase ThiF [Aneurinibacillus sp. Ricciae_BoGa-3]
MNDRYSRQERFAGIGVEGQKKLSHKHVLIIGAGALGTGNAESLVRAGVGKVTIVDRDYVEWSNLQRQQLYCEQDAVERMPKAIAAKKRLSAINSFVDIEAIVQDVSANEIEQLMAGVDLILDATDNFETRLLINDASQKHRIPWIYGACVGSYGLTYTIIPGKSPCLNCLLEKVPLGGGTCDTAGIISPAVQMVVAYQTAEALKILVEDWAALRSSLISFDLWKNQHASIQIGSLKNNDCPSCGNNPTYPYLKEQNNVKTAVLCGRDTVQIRPSVKSFRTLDHLAEDLAKQGVGSLAKNPYLVSFKVDTFRMVIFEDGRVLVHGTQDAAEAKTLFRRFLDNSLR